VKLRGDVSYKLRVEFDRETDGCWFAEVLDLPGVMAYGATQRWRQ
jgi:predicted RNase H-like HicB family nuclease